MTEILLKRSSIYPSFTADKISASSGNGARDRWISRQTLHPLRYGPPKLTKSLAESPGNDHEDAGEVMVLNEENGSDHVHPRSLVRASTRISRKI